MQLITLVIGDELLERHALEQCRELFEQLPIVARALIEGVRVLEAAAKKFALFFLA